LASEKFNVPLKDQFPESRCDSYRCCTIFLWSSCYNAIILG